MATQHELDTHERTHRLQRDLPRRSRFRRAALVPALPPVPSLITEADPLRAIRLRDRSYRVAILIADIVAAMLLVGIAEVWSATSALSWTVLALPIVVPLVNAANGLYQRDEQVLNKSTLDEAPITFRAATIATVIIYLIQSAVLVPSIGAKVVGFTWVGLTVLLPACRTLARAAIREWLPPERCLVLGDEAHARQLASKLSGGSGVKSELVDVMPLDSIGHAKRSAVEDLRETVNRMDVHRVVVAGGEGTHDDELEAISAAKAVGVNVSVLPRVLEIVGSSASYDYVDG